MIELELNLPAGEVSRRSFTVDEAGQVTRSRVSTPAGVGQDQAWLDGLSVLNAPIYELWVVIGQSQAVGIDTGVSPYAEKTAGVLEVRHSDHALIPYLAPGENDTSGTNFAETFAVDLARLYSPYVVPVVYNLAVGGTGFTDNRWNVADVGTPEGDLLTATKAGIAAVLAAHPNMRLGGYLWHQGRKDRGDSAAYEAKLLAMIAELQALGSKTVTPFILGTLEQSFVDSDAGGAVVNTAIINAANAAAGRITVDLSARVAGADGTHFDTAELVKIGHQYANAFFAWCADQGETALNAWRVPGRQAVVYV